MKYFIFENYEVVKLDVYSPNLVNLFIVLFFLFIVFFFSVKTQNSLHLLCKEQTNQLKGIAIFFVVLGHLWVHVSCSRASLVLSGDAVFLFLFLSGFGLSRSRMLTTFDLHSFVTKRVVRIFGPYWLATLLVVFLDYIILQKKYSLDDLILTFVGINLSPELRHMDYARWFVTFILLWYFLFFLAHVLVSAKSAPFLLLFSAVILSIFHYYYLDFGWYQFIAFPVGCLTATYYEKILSGYSNNRIIFLWISIIGSVIVLLYYYLMSISLIKSYVYENIPNIFLELNNELLSLLLIFSLIFLFDTMGYREIKSKFLVLLGSISYEIFLVHGLFLIKYNPIIKHQSSVLLVVEFVILFCCIIIIAKLLNCLSTCVLNTQVSELADR